MNVGRVGYNISRKFILPMAVSLPVLVSCANKSTKDFETQNQEIQTELEVQPNQDRVQLSDKEGRKGGIPRGLKDVMAFLLGFGTVYGLAAARSKRVEHDVKQKFYENNPSIVEFEKIEDGKEQEKFIKRRDELRVYLSKILREGMDNGESTYTPNMDDYLEHVNKFTKYYPDRKALLSLGIFPFADTRLKPEERSFVFAYIYSKATSLDYEWRWENQFKFLNSAASYDEILHRMEMMRKLEAQQKEQADAERAQSKAEAEFEKNYQPEDSHKILFKNVGGQDKAIDAIKKGILFPIKYPKAFENTNLEHGFVLYGPPGTGKTLLAEALSNEANAYFIKINGPELDSKWVGETEANWRDTFDEARESQPSIIFIDEFDSIASQRGGGDVHGDKALNQLLGLISDIKPDEKIFIIAATNRLDSIDPAFIRSGRLGTHIELKAPETLEDVVNIFNIHAKNKKVSSEFNVKDFCSKLMTFNPTGADIAYIVNEAREKSLERKHIYEKMDNNTFEDVDIERLYIEEEDFEEALKEFHNSKFHRTKIGFGN